MNRHRVMLAMLGLSIFVVFGQGPGQAVAQVNVDVGGIHVSVGGSQPPPPEGVVVLTRGPIHEAFAQPVVLDEGAAFTITRRPPAPIEEMPPDQRPEGNHIVWIPGYWSWDTDRNDFIWVSGCWRAVPPNNSWVPGYWAQVSGGYQWIAGFWTDAGTQEIEYLPAPPASLEAGPQGAGSPDSIWVPGCWVRQDGRYAWRPGFWEQARPNWVWVPSQYISTPRGWVYVDGYWDYPLDSRGVEFLPVYLSPSLYGRGDYRYSPEIALDLGALTLDLFSSPQRHQYYFGDYYGSEYAQQGYYPWYEVTARHDWYDPIFVQQQWQHRDDRSWAANQRAEYTRRRADTSLRPARTYEAMTAQVARLPEKDRRQAQLARPIKEVVSEKTTPFKYATLDAKTREATVTQAKDVHAYKDKRAQWESPSVAPKTGVEPKTVVTPVVTPREPAPTPPRELPAPTVREVTPGPVVVPRQPVAQDVQPEKVKIPKPPIAVREPVRDKELTPPPRPEQPKPDLNAKPKPSKADDAPDRSKDKGGPDKPDKP